jgi:hypothetical protein
MRSTGDGHRGMLTSSGLTIVDEGCGREGDDVILMIVR